MFDIGAPLLFADAIAECAKTNGIDLIIVGMHGRGAAANLLMGSGAERVLPLSPY